TYTWEPQHPPLARVAAALGPYLLGARSIDAPKTDDIDKLLREGTNILYRGGYDKLLSASRAGILPFFWIACFVVFAWGRRYFDDATAAVAVVLFSFLPPVLAHAGLATTDMALTALLGAAFLAGLAWVEAPDWKPAAIFGVCAGLATISKFSAVAYLPAAFVAAAAVYFGTERPAAGDLARAVRKRAAMFGVALLAGAVVIWAGYRFSLHGELIEGIRSVVTHNRQGHAAYLLGQRSQTGWW